MGLDAAMRGQLVQARERILSQLDELRFRADRSGRGNTPPPDFRSELAELEHELREINEILGTKDGDDT